MRVFVAGATGAIGRQLVPRLVAAGHDVYGTTRSASKRALGWQPAHPSWREGIVAGAAHPGPVAVRA